MTTENYGYEINRGETREGYYIDYSGKNGIRTRVFFNQNGTELYNERMR